MGIQAWKQKSKRGYLDLMKSNEIIMLISINVGPPRVGYLPLLKKPQNPKFWASLRDKPKFKIQKKVKTEKSEELKQKPMNQLTNEPMEPLSDVQHLRLLWFLQRLIVIKLVGVKLLRDTCKSIERC